MVARVFFSCIGGKTLSIYGVFWCVKRSCTSFRYGVMNDEDRKKEKKKKKINIYMYEVQFSDSIEG